MGSINATVKLKPPSMRRASVTRMGIGIAAILENFIETDEV